MTLVTMNSGRNMLRDRFFPNPFQTILDEAIEKTDVNKKSIFHPRTDIAETADAYYLELSLPGVKKEDIKIDLLNDKLTVSGDRKIQNETDDKKIHRLESQYGSFTRTYQLPEHINKEAIDAQFENGILNLILPKSEEKQAKQIVVK